MQTSGLEVRGLTPLCRTAPSSPPPRRRSGPQRWRPASRPSAPDRRRCWPTTAASRPRYSPRLDQMVQVGAGIVARGGAAARRVERAPGRRRAWRSCRLSLPAQVKAWPWRPERVGITQSNMSTPRATALDQVERRADAHQVARLVAPAARQRVSSSVSSIASLPLADRQAADGVAREIHRHAAPRPSARRRSAIGAALHDAEQRLPGARCPCSRCASNARLSARPSAATARRRARSPRASAGSAMHSSSCIWMSAPSRHWISIGALGRQHVRASRR